MGKKKKKNVFSIQMVGIQIRTVFYSGPSYYVVESVSIHFSKKFCRCGMAQRVNA